MARKASELQGLYAKGRLRVSELDGETMHFEIWTTRAAAKVVAHVGDECHMMEYDGSFVYSFRCRKDRPKRGLAGQKRAPGLTYVHHLPYVGMYHDALRGYAALARSYRFEPREPLPEYAKKLPGLKWFRLVPVRKGEEQPLLGHELLTMGISPTDGLVRLLLGGRLGAERVSSQDLLVTVSRIESRAILPDELVLPAGVTKEGFDRRAETDVALALNRRLKDMLEVKDRDITTLRRKLEDLAARLADKDRTIETKDKMLKLLQSQLKDLKGSFAELAAALEVLKKRPPLPVFRRALPAAVDGALAAFSRKYSPLVQYLPKYGMIRLKSDLTFAVGGDLVKSDAAEALRALASVLNGAEAAKFHVYVAGHTDDVPIRRPSMRRRHPNNWYLSVHRAVAVQQELVGAGVAPSRIAAMGFGEYHPIGPNKPGKRGSAANRRIEIWVVSPDRFMTAGGPDAKPE